MKIKAQAKVNLALDVVGIMENEYHELDMIMAPVSLYNEIEIHPSQQDLITCDTMNLPKNSTIHRTLQVLKEKKPSFRTIAVEPSASPVLSGGTHSPHKIQGIGAGFVPGNFDASVATAIVPVEDNDAIRASRLLAKKEGLLVGISSGAALHAAIELAKKPAYEGKTIVALLPDTGERYLSTVLYAFEEYPV